MKRLSILLFVLIAELHAQVGVKLTSLNLTNILYTDNTTPTCASSNLPAASSVPMNFAVWITNTAKSSYTQCVSNTVSWVTASGSGSTSPLTTKGDLYSFSTINARFPVGADGLTIIADSSQTLGMRWGNPASSLNIYTNGTLIGTRPSLNYIPSTTILWPCVDNAGTNRVDCTPSISTSVPTYDTVHAGVNYCALTSTGVQAMTCSLVATQVLSGYTSGQCFDFVTDTPNPVSIAIDLAGTKTLYSADGANAVPSGVILANYPFTACYDGAAFRLKSVGVPPGLNVWSRPSPISVTGQVAAITTATLCANTSGNCDVAGLYRLTAYVASTVVCATPGPGAVGLTVTFTDEVGTKSAQTVPLDVTGATSLSGTLALGTTTANATGTASFWSSGANAIQYATSYTACTTGTGTYSARIAIERVF